MSAWSARTLRALVLLPFWISSLAAYATAANAAAGQPSSDTERGVRAFIYGNEVWRAKRVQ
jgi:hypothetical protein